jgi:hypothetical protein
LADEKDLSSKSKASVKCLERTVQSAVDHAITMGASVAEDLRNSFALSTKGPSSMLGKQPKRGTVVNKVYTDAEDRRSAADKAAAKRLQKPVPKSGLKSKPKPRPKKRPASRASYRPSKRRRESQWDEVRLCHMFSSFVL